MGIRYDREEETPENPAANPPADQAPQNGGWKHNPLIGIVLAAVIVFCGYNLFRNQPQESLIPPNFPHTYLTVADNGNMGGVIIKRGKSDIKTPFTENGKEYWEAYLCRNESCPWLVDPKNSQKAPYIFAYVRPQLPKPPVAKGDAAPQPEMTDDYMLSQVCCPLCKAAYEKAAEADKQKIDLAAVERYQTEEALQILEKIREEYKKQNKD